MSMDEKDLCKALRLCASEESRCVVCEYRHHKGCIAQLQRDAADALERLEATNKTLMRLVRLMPACEQPRDIPMPPHPDGDPYILACVGCGSGEYLTNWDGNRNTYCGQCGQKIDWSGEDEQSD